MKISSLRILFILSVLITVNLACNLPQSGSNLPPTPAPVDQAELEQLEKQLRDSLADPNEEEVTVTITQEQLTAFLAAELAEQNDQTFTDPVVILTNGQVEVYGKLSQSGFRTNTKIVLQPRIDENGQPKLDLISMDLGPLPVPAGIRSQFEDMVDDMLDQYLRTYSDRIRVTDITVLEGRMTITGVKQ
jgi:uncharacterized protein YpmS